MEDDGFILTESCAIMRYICAKKGNAGIYPCDMKKRARIDQALDRCGLVKYSNFYPQLFGGDKASDETVAEFESSLQKFYNFFPTTDTVSLSGLNQMVNIVKGYVVNEELTLVDLLLLQRLSIVQCAGYDLSKKFPQFVKFLELHKNDNWFKKIMIEHEKHIQTKHTSFAYLMKPPTSTEF